MKVFLGQVLRNVKQFQAALKYGYRSGLEIKVSDHLKELKQDFRYECFKIEWEDLMYRTYTPDFLLPNGIIIETKGRFVASDRRKHLAIQKQHNNLDIRFVFESSKRKLSKGSKGTYASWCEKYNFLYYDRIIPQEWLKENNKKTKTLWQLSDKSVIPFPLKKIRRT